MLGMAKPTPFPSLKFLNINFKNISTLLLYMINFIRNRNLSTTQKTMFHNLNVSVRLSSNLSFLSMNQDGICLKLMIIKI